MSFALMTDTYVTGCLTPTEWPLAFPLVRIAHPEWTLANWRKLAQHFSRRQPEQGGLMAVRDRRGMIHGLFSYSIEKDLTNNTCLRVSNLVFVRLPGGRIDDAILQGIEHLSKECACQSLTIDVPVTQAKQMVLDRHSLDLHQFEMRGMMFCRNSV